MCGKNMKPQEGEDERLSVTLEQQVGDRACKSLDVME